MTCRWFTLPNPTAWRGAWIAIGTPRIICGRMIRFFNLDWKPEDVKPAEFVAKYGQPSDAREDFSKKKHLTQSEIGQTLKERWKITPPTNCQGCHR
jgi:hypothetical protein